MRDLTTPTPDPAPLPAAFRHRRAFLIVLGVAAVHAWAVWGYVSPFWGDHGRWLHVIARFAEGEIPYRDFTYANPPLSLWVVGGIARITGTTFAAITATMTTLYLLTFTLLLFALRRLVPDLVLVIGLPSLLFAISFAFRHGASLPAGTNSASGVVGFMCVLGAAWLMLETAERPSVRRAVGAGVLIALALLSKHDFWAASAYLLVAGGFFLSRRKAPTPVQVTMPIAFAITTGVALTIAALRAGWLPVIEMLAGSGRAMNIALQSTPSLERLVVEIAASAALGLTAVTALWLCLAISDKVAKRWAGALLLVFLTAVAIHLGTSVGIGSDLMTSGLPRLPTLTEEALWREFQRGRAAIPAAVSYFDTRLQAHLFPLILPPLLLAVIFARWNRWYDVRLRDRVALLLGLCIVARTRYAFAGAGWYNIMLELPAYALYLQLICGPARQKAARAVRAAFAVLIVLGLYSYVSLAVGPLTTNGRRPGMRTRAGVVHWPAGSGNLYRTVDSLITAADPGGERPVYALGASGGWNFFLHRRNPLPYTDGLIANHPGWSDSATALLNRARPRPFLIMNRYVLRPALSSTSLFEWEHPPEPGRFSRFDLPWFRSVVAACIPLGDGDSTAVVRVYDCP